MLVHQNQSHFSSLVISDSSVKRNDYENVLTERITTPMQIITEPKGLPTDIEHLGFNHYYKWKMVEDPSVHTERFIIHINVGNTA